MSQASRNPDRSTWGRRCSLGCQDWPDTNEFERCLTCGQSTRRYSGLTPMMLSEARSMLKQAKFNAFYAKHCERLRIPVAGDFPTWYVDQLPPISPDLLRPSAKQVS
jgi:hypothetical protein